MDHGQSFRLKESKATAPKTRVGLILFAVYAAVYAIFVIINTVSPQVMKIKTIIFGLDLALTYGIGLIVLAIVLGLAYNRICTNLENTHGEEESEGDEE